MKKIFKKPWFLPLLSVSIVLVLTAIILALMGRIWICDCGYIKLWHGDNQSNQNSQHISDWYTFSHIIHGFIFFYGLVWLGKRIRIPVPIFWATLIEALWEIVENTPMVINHYRTATISLDYFGDTILNSTFDILAMIAGFYLAKKLPWQIIIILILIMELGVGYLIRDNLTLNVIMLFYPIEAIKTWQLAVI